MGNLLDRWLRKGILGMMLIAMLLGFFFGQWLGDGGPEAKSDRSSEPPAVEQARADEHLIYVCPMMCVPPMDEPGRCPVCGMDLLPTAAPEALDEKGPAQLQLGPEAVKLADIRTVPLERRFATAEVKLFGRIDYDPAHTTKITAFMPGLIDRVYVKRAGQFVRWGDPLFDIYSSDLLETQQQLIEAMKYVPGFMAFQEGTPHVAREAPVQVRKTPGASDRRSPEAEEALKAIAGLRHKLSILGLPKRDIDQLMKIGEATGIATVYASMYGQVVDQNAFEGTYVNTGTPIFTLADPQFVWVKLDAYETDYPWIRKNQRVTFHTDAYPGETFTGKVIYIDPVFDPTSRTFDIGVISTEDQGGRLKAGMLVRASIYAELTADGKLTREDTPLDQAPLVIPASAPLITGKRAVVYVELPESSGVFEGREVLLGPKGRDSYVVLAGLEEGERVVVNGNFRIDSAVQILAMPSMMSLQDGQSVLAHQRHGGSKGMHDDYWSERTRSRMGTQGSMHRKDDAEHEHGMSSRMEPAERPHHRIEGVQGRSSTINRRKPGAYGDTTRPAAPYRQH